MNAYDYNVHMYVCMYVHTNVRTYIRMYICMHVCMHVVVENEEYEIKCYNIYLRM